MAHEYRNEVEAVRNLDGSRTIDVTVFHGSNDLFSAFEIQPRPAGLPVVGVFFAADEGYAGSHGQYVYECRIRSDRADWEWGGSVKDITLEKAAAANVSVWMQVFDPETTRVNDAFVICNDMSEIEIVNVYDQKNDCYVEMAVVPKM